MTASLLNCFYISYLLHCKSVRITDGQNSLYQNIGDFNEPDL
jgi:hypothetical protein